MALVKVPIGSGVYFNQIADRAPLWRFSERCSPRDVYEARQGLESHAAHLAALRCDEPGATRLKAATEAMRDALAADDISAMAAADAAFHDCVFDLMANPVLAGMYRPVRDMMVETQQLAYDATNPLGRYVARA